MHVRDVSTYKDSVEQTAERATDESAVRADAVACPECDGEIVTADREVVCGACGLVVEEQYVDLAPRFQLKNVEKDADKRGLETESPYFLDPNGSPYQDAPLGVTFPTRRSDWRFDGTDTPVSDGTYEKWDDIRYRQVRRVVDSRDNWRTDALQDIKTMGRNVGIPRHVCTRATALFREALDARLAGGRMAYESLAVGALVVAARDAGCSQSVDDVAEWARTPHERACAGARKIRLGLDLVETTPAVRPGVTADIVGTLADDGHYTGVDGDRADVTDLGIAAAGLWRTKMGWFYLEGGRQTEGDSLSWRYGLLFDDPLVDYDAVMPFFEAITDDLPQKQHLWPRRQLVLAEHGPNDPLAHAATVTDELAVPADREWPFLLIHGTNPFYMTERKTIGVPSDSLPEDLYTPLLKTSTLLYDSNTRPRDDATYRLEQLYAVEPPTINSLFVSATVGRGRN